MAKRHLKILISKELWDFPEIQALAEEHELCQSNIFKNVDIDDFDLILSPKAWRMTPGLATATKTMVELPIKAARAVKSPRKEKNEA